MYTCVYIYNIFCIWVCNSVYKSVYALLVSVLLFPCILNPLLSSTLLTTSLPSQLIPLYGLKWHCHSDPFFSRRWRVKFLPVRNESMDPPPYRPVFGLFLAWEDDDGANAWRHGVNAFKVQLEKLMARPRVLLQLPTYSHGSSSSNDSWRALDARLTELMDKGNGGSDSQRAISTLLIVYYGGHAIPEPEDAADLLLVPWGPPSPL